MADHNEFGKIAEELAVKFLEEKNYKILARNYRYLKAEIDIITEFGDEIIIVEVKARHTDAFIEPQEAVNKKKIKLLVTAADAFLQEKNIEKEVRFDIISVLPNQNGVFQISHFPNAFEAIDAN